jgi:uncharacterized protein YkwD
MPVYTGMDIITQVVSWILRWLGREPQPHYPPAPPIPFPPDPPPFPPNPVPPPSPSDDYSQELLRLHNAERAKKNLPVLALDDQLHQAAKSHAEYMAKVNRLAHDGIGDGSPWDRMKAAGYHYSSAAENIAWNQRNPQDVMQSWMGSSEHRQNIMGRFQHVGFGLAKTANGSIYWCAVFGSPQ